MNRSEYQKRIAELQAETKVKPFLHDDQKLFPLEIRRCLSILNAINLQDRIALGIIGDEVDSEKDSNIPS